MRLLLYTALGLSALGLYGVIEPDRPPLTPEQVESQRAYAAAAAAVADERSKLRVAYCNTKPVKKLLGDFVMKASADGHDVQVVRAWYGLTFENKKSFVLLASKCLAADSWVYLKDGYSGREIARKSAFGGVSVD